MIAKFFDALFGCSHNHYSFPRSSRPNAGMRRISAETITGTYIVCLDCGKELPYDWEEMKVLSSEAESRRDLDTVASKEATPAVI